MASITPTSGTLRALWTVAEDCDLPGVADAIILGLHPPATPEHLAAWTQAVHQASGGRRVAIRVQLPPPARAIVTYCAQPPIAAVLPTLPDLAPGSLPDLSRRSPHAPLILSWSDWLHWRAWIRRLAAQRTLPRSLCPAPDSSADASWTHWHAPSHPALQPSLTLARWYADWYGLTPASPLSDWILAASGRRFPAHALPAGMSFAAWIQHWTAPSVVADRWHAVQRLLAAHPLAPQSSPSSPDQEVSSSHGA